VTQSKPDDVTGMEAIATGRNNMATRRQVLQTSGALLLSLLTAATASAQADYPGSREVRLIVPFAPGTTPDILTRYFSENMRPFLGGTIVVENVKRVERLVRAGGCAGRRRRGGPPSAPPPHEG
jgi:hypothetical protein